MAYINAWWNKYKYQWWYNQVLFYEARILPKDLYNYQWSVERVWQPPAPLSACHYLYHNKPCTKNNGRLNDT